MIAVPIPGSHSFEEAALGPLLGCIRSLRRALPSSCPRATMDHCLHPRDLQGVPTTTTTSLHDHLVLVVELRIPHWWHQTMLHSLSYWQTSAFIIWHATNSKGDHQGERERDRDIERESGVDNLRWNAPPFSASICYSTLFPFLLPVCLGFLSSFPSVSSSFPLSFLFDQCPSYLRRGWLGVKTAWGAIQSIKLLTALLYFARATLNFEDRGSHSTSEEHGLWKMFWSDLSLDAEASSALRIEVDVQVSNNPDDGILRLTFMRHLTEDSVMQPVALDSWSIWLLTPEIDMYIYIYAVCCLDRP